MKITLAIASTLLLQSAFALSPVEASPAAFEVAASVQNPAPSAELAPTLLRLGLSAEAMATSGCTAADVTAAASALNTYLIATPGAIAAADEAWSNANQAVSGLKRKIKSGLATEAEAASLGSLETALSAAATTRDDLLANANVAATASLTTAKTNLLYTIRDNSDWSLPTYYLAADRTQESWVSLRDALDEQRIAAKYDEAVSTESLAVIASALGDSTVAAAKVNLETNLAAIEAAWTAATE